MGNHYKLWYPLMRSGSSQRNRQALRFPATFDGDDVNNPDSVPSLVYPVQRIPVDSIDQGNSEFTQLPAPDDTVFAGLHKQLRLPRAVLYIGAVSDDVPAGTGTDPCGYVYPTFPNTAHDYYMSIFGNPSVLGSGLAMALAPYGIPVYEGGAATLPWVQMALVLERRFFPPALEPVSDFIGGDVYAIITINRNAYALAPDGYFDQFATTYASPPCGGRVDTFLQSIVVPNPNSTDLTQPFYRSLAPDAGPSEAVIWTSLVSKFRNWHGLICDLPWIGDQATIVDTGPIPHEPYNLGVRRRVDLNVADSTATLQANVEFLNSISPVCPGDATWEYAAVGQTEPVSFFLEKIKSWYGIA